MAERIVLDTDMDSRLTQPELSAWALGWLARKNLIAVTAPTILERRYGYQAGSRDWEGVWAAYREMLDARTIEVLPLDLYSAELAGHLRAIRPIPPATRRRGKAKRRGKAAGRLSWLLDILIASIAARHGSPLFTANEGDFSILRESMPAPYRLRLVVYPALP